MDIQTEFTEKFHNLWNAPIAQSKKNFKSFVNEIDNKITDENARVELIANLEPRNKLEISFKVDLLMRYQMYEKVLEILQASTNSLYISNILKNWTFFKETFKNITANELVNDILPNLSYSTRMKVLNRISKNLFDEKLADQYFESIENTYEIVSARVMLGSCSIPIIKEKMEKYNLILTLKQLERILRRDVTFLDYYFEHTRTNSKVKVCDKIKLLKSIFKRDNELFWRVNDKYKIISNCGRRFTRKIIKENEHFLTDKRDEYPVNLKKRIVFQVWKRKPELFKSFIRNNSPNDMRWYFIAKTSYYSSITEYQCYIPKDKRYNFFNDIFQEKFGCNIHDRPEVVTEAILLLMPEELRDNILKMKIELNEDSLNICRPEISFPILLDKIKHSSELHKRIEYVDMLLTSCVNHENESYLLKVLKYVEKRHRNDTQVLKKFLRGLQCWKNLETLSTEHWTYIDAIQKLLIIQNQTANEIFFLVKRIGHLLNNSLDICEQMRKYLETIIKKPYLFDIFTEIPQHKKYCIMELKKYISDINDTNVSNKILLRYLKFVHQYNIGNPEDRIPFSHFVPIIQTLSDEHLADLLPLIMYYIKFCYTDLNPIVWQHVTKFFSDKSLFSWYLQHHKNEILDKFNLILPILSAKTHKMFIFKLDEYSYRHILEITTNFCITQIQHAPDVQLKINAINILAVINQFEFLKISAEFKPTENGKIDPSIPVDHTKLLAAVLSNLKKLMRPLDGLNIVAKFCKGDYLKYALGSVYSTILRTPLENAKTILAELRKLAVSVRKHAIHINKIICGLDEFCTLIKEQTVTEKNRSIKTILFKKSLQYLQIMPVEKCWELVKITIHGINKNDVHVHKLLLEIGKIPEQYRAAYIPEAYAELSSNKDPSINHKKYELISLTPVEIIDELNQELLLIFMSEVIFDQQLTSYEIWTNLIFYSSGEKQEALLDCALKRFDEYHRANPDEFIHVKVSKFLSPLCVGAVHFRLRTPLVQKFANLWLNSFSPEVDVTNRIYLSFIVAYAESDYNFQMLGVKVNKLLQEYLITYNDYLLPIFENTLYNFLNTKKFEDRFLFIKAFLGDLSSVPICLVSIRLLVQQGDIPKEAVDDYLDLVRKIKERPELCIKTHSNNLWNRY
ncbi:hypothetical protein QE152_g13313 [Popillia japonica]|uniref:Uncharacterized protein n=1 Tax=Popillia japonica TaxID=7064 RepID=A0AAW1LDE1_POPJA